MTQKLGESINSPAPTSTLDAIILSAPRELQDMIRDDYMDDMNKLPLDNQVDIFEEWKNQDPKNIGIFDTIFRMKGKMTVDTKVVVMNKKEMAADTKGIKKGEESEEIEEQYREAARVAKSVNDSAENIKRSTGNKYGSEIQIELQSDIEKPETRQFLSTLGIDIEKNPADIQTDTVQKILLARASAQVYLRHREEISRDPNLKSDIDTIDSLISKLGFSTRAKSVDIRNLLIDRPRSDREAITSTVNSLTKGSPDTLVTRTGDRLTFSDPKNEKYSYEIDMSKQPSRLAKTLNGLSISRDVVPLSPEQKEKKEAYEAAKGKLDKGEREYSQGINEFWGARRDEYSLMGANMEQGEPGKETKKDINIYSSIFLPENRSKQTQYEMIEQELANGNIRSEDRANKLNNMKQLTADIKSTNLSQMLATGETENHSKINTMLEQRYEKINQLQKSNQEIITAKAAVSKNPENTENQYDTFDTTARDNLSWLVDNRFDRMGPDANIVLTRIIAEVNRTRAQSNKIDLTRPLDPSTDGQRLKAILEKIGGTSDILTDGERLPIFQQRMTAALNYNADNPNSIEGLMRAIRMPSPT